MGSKHRVAAVHAAPVYMDKDATTDKIVQLIEEAGKHFIDLLAFPEAFLPGYPYFVHIFSPLQLFGAVATYTQASVTRDGPEIKKIQTACANNGVAIALGFSERISGGTAIFNSQIYIDKKGTVLGVHRKLQPTLGERVLWAQGSGKSLRAHASGDGYVIGGLLCSENGMNGARQALIEDGLQIHASAWPALSAISPMADVVDLQTEAMTKGHAVTAQVFVIAASDFVDNRCLDWIKTNIGPQDVLVEGGGWSTIIAPDSRTIAGPHIGSTEKLVQCEIDLAHISFAKVLTDAAGHYKRPEVLKFSVNREALWPDELEDGASSIRIADAA
ncbi:nitrilase [Xylogone sp. PMI_703]|nr:nitrilase [Xylogone sp. PMI_703]